MKLTNWTLDETLGKLHRLWWWVLDYAEDGDVKRFAYGIFLTRLDPHTNPTALYSLLVESGWIDKSGLIHDWLDFAGRYLKGKHHSSNPKKLEAIYRKHKVAFRSPKGSLKGSLKSPTNLNLPTLNLDTINNNNHFEKLYEAYPKKVGRKAAERYFKASVKTEQDIKDIYKALEHYLRSKRVANGRIQDAKTWFNNWPDWINFTEDACKKCNDTGKFTSITGYSTVCDCPAGKSKKVPSRV